MYLIPDFVIGYYKTCTLVGIVGGYKLYKYMNSQSQKNDIDRLTQQWIEMFQKLHESDPSKYRKEVKAIRLIDNTPTSSIWNIFGEDITGITHTTANDFIANIKLASKTDGDFDLAIVINTIGGEVSAVKRICDAINTFKTKHNSHVYSIVMSKALSGGSIIALSSDEIMMNDYAVLSKIDPHISGFSIKYYKDIKPTENHLTQSTVAGMCKDADATLNSIIDTHVKPRYSNDEYNTIVHNFLEADNMHSFTFTKSECQQMGIKVRDLPEDAPDMVPLFDTFNT